MNKQTVRLIAGVLIYGVCLVLDHGFGVNFYLSLVLYVAAYLLLGGDVIWHAVKHIVQGKFMDENFLMTVATIGAFALGESAEAVAVMLFFQVGESLQEHAVHKSKQSIARLMNIKPDYANVWVDGALKQQPPESVPVGAVIVVKPGEKIPLDGEVLEGSAWLDTTALTGESAPRQVAVSDMVLSGCVNQDGLLTIRVTQPFGESTVAKIIDLVENAAGKKAPTEKFVRRFARYYTPAVVGAALLTAVVPPLLFGGLWATWIQRGLIFLVISCPCALVISIPLGFMGGIGGASRKGILVKGGHFLEALSRLDMVVFDKTGTLTKGDFSVSDIQAADGFSKEAVLEAAAHAEAFSSHPIAISILRAYGRPVDTKLLHDYNAIAGQGTRVTVDQKVIAAGNDKLMNALHIPFVEASDYGTKVYVALDNQFMGCIVIADTVKSDSRKAVAALKTLGVRKTVMLTGDETVIAETVAKAVGIDAVYGGLLPHEKVAITEQLNTEKQPRGRLAFVGDGINDAPVLAMADVGVAMGGLGTDAAIEAADVVLMTDEPTKLAEAVTIARFTKRVIYQNIVLALGVKGLVLLLGAIGAATMWAAVFADVGVALLAVLNATRIIRGHKAA